MRLLPLNASLLVKGIDVEKRVGQQFFCRRHCERLAKLLRFIIADTGGKDKRWYVILSFRPVDSRLAERSQYRPEFQGL